MLDVNWMCENPVKVREALKNKQQDDGDFAELLSLNDERKKLQFEGDELNREIKEQSRLFQSTARVGGDLGPLKARSGELKARKKGVDGRFAEVKARLLDIALRIPNIPDDRAPRGGEEANVVTRVEGVAPELGFEGQDHNALCESLEIADTTRRAVKLAGSGFALYQGAGARLVRALVHFFLELHTREHGYTEVLPPLLANAETMTGTGQLPKFGDDMYHCGRDELYLIPTAEVPVTNMLRDEILSRKALPKAFTAYTPCFRREAGSYGKDTRGLMRLHQFNKVELVRFCLPERSDAEHALLLSHAEEALRRLGLHYRVLELATADMSASAARCFDLEAYAPVSKRWFEVSSVSNFRDYQARRARVRYRKEEKKVDFVHTLNGSGLAVPRVIICLLEQYQRPDGSVEVPEVLRDFMGCDRLLPTSARG